MWHGFVPEPCTGKVQSLSVTCRDFQRLSETCGACERSESFRDFQRLPEIFRDLESFPLTGGAVRPEHRYEPHRRSPTGGAVQPGAQVLSAGVHLTGGAVQPEQRRDPVSADLRGLLGMGTETFRDFQ